MESPLLHTSANQYGQSKNVLDINCHLHEVLDLPGPLDIVRLDGGVSDVVGLPFDNEGQWNRYANYKVN